jgi:hypothetical protein
MTLLDMANFICGKVNQTDVDDLAECRGFLKQRHEMIWNDQIWKDSLVEYRKTLEPTGYTVESNWLPTKGVLLLPPIIQRVLAVRTDSRHLNVQRPEFYYRIDYDAFAKTGVPSEFLVLPAVVWETDVPAQFFVYSTTGGSTAVIDYLDADEVTLLRISGPIVPGMQANSSRLDRLTLDSQTEVNVVDLLSTNILRVPGGQTLVPKRQRIRIVEVPDPATGPFTIRVLGKRTCPSFSADLDEPAINGMDNCLLAFGHADMLQRERHYAKAALVIEKEAAPLLEQLKAIEVVQMAHSQRIVPEMGYADDYLLRGSKSSF